MPGNATARFENVALLSVASVLPGRVTTSDDIEARLAPSLKRLKLRSGMLTRVAGVRERRNWARGETVDAATIAAGKQALAQAGVSPSDVGLLINTSVTRSNLEPSVAVALHHGLDLPSSAINFDIANACLGFINGMSLAATMIDSGQIRYAVVVAGEDADEIQVNTIERLLQTESGRDGFMSEFASLTLGSGSAAAVLGRADEHPAGHRIVGGVTRAATQFHKLCVGSVDGMFTDAKALLKGGLALVVSAWKEASAEWDWKSMNRYITHQVSSVHTDAIVKAVNLDRSRVPTTFPRLGNIGPASVPITLVEEQASLQRGDRVLLMGVGSGLNTAMMELAW
ncbi:3-oxoacyl-ACP synthase III [Microbacterium sp. zg.Y1090]|uniref:3-oxoacyl-ACP synthase III n=1 Tax=Microbacterium TaxID=33882 RepID=UPI00214C3A6E|nr:MULTISPECIES: 3-oxoacyl-ACP synthase III [unclassified Microbacterium]MCR2812928.1 3-oxoacyl-ACP synthase III [Microbacterium sp. zg.Y1084]MCR2817263.1 3-oxoacyl-ACP synthase III [Microbacterium sp. zg.Y1090]MDL5486069.1 3-oxoacyl-ACP synthase III [Microbacterium sp. zg-Y1211]WIM29248.1 3-oxoacyl-ACP synthase III [Microbacterium sp. zg-Y1090]